MVGSAERGSEGGCLVAGPARMGGRAGKGHLAPYAHRRHRTGVTFCLTRIPLFATHAWLPQVAMDQVMEYCFETDLVGARARVGSSGEVGGGSRRIAPPALTVLSALASLTPGCKAATQGNQAERREDGPRPLAGIRNNHATPCHRTAASRLPSPLSTHHVLRGQRLGPLPICCFTPPLPRPPLFPRPRPTVVLPPAAPPACVRRRPRLQPGHAGDAPGVGQHKTRG